MALVTRKSTSLVVKRTYDALASLKRETEGWTYWREQPASYRQAAAWWIVSAKRSETRKRRIALLVEHSRKGERIPQFLSPARS